jgi:hypothetical protein
MNQQLKNRNFNPDTLEGEYNLLNMWAVIRAARWKAGALAGVFAGVVTLVVGAIFCAIKGMDPTIPMRIMGLPYIGNAAMAFGSMYGILVGLIGFFSLTVFLGVAYAHFTGVNNKKALFGMGLTWGAYGWIFITCLFMPANRDYFAAEIPRGVMFFAWLVFGLSLMSVAWFDKGNTRK